MNSSRRHISALDGVRGLAVLAVFLYHYGGGAQSQNPVFRAFGGAIHAGWSGVTLFFLLSGFLITGILWDRGRRPGWWKDFYWRRTLRIFPLYFVALFLVFVSAVAAGHWRLIIRHIWTYVFYLQDVPVLPANWFNLGSPLPLTHFWSLAVEEQFYLIWPFIVIRMKSLRQARMACAAVFAGSVLFRVGTCLLCSSQVPFVVSLPARVGELSAGGYLAMSFREPIAWRRLERLAPLALLLGVAGFLASAYSAHSFAAKEPAVYLAGLPCITLAFAAWLVLSLRPGPVERMMNVRWLRWLGTISYGVYIFHVLLGPVFWSIASAILPVASHYHKLMLFSFIAACLTLVVAQISFRFFEQPILRWKDRVPGSRRRSVTLPVEP